LKISRVHVALRADDLGVYKANRNGKGIFAYF
jgi:hypothetical protein